MPLVVAEGAQVRAADGRRGETEERIFAETQAVGFSDIPRDMFWMTSVVGCAVLAVELRDVEAAAALLHVLEPFAGEVALSGGTSQGPIAAYLGHRDRSAAHLTQPRTRRSEAVTRC